MWLEGYCTGLCRFRSRSKTVHCYAICIPFPVLYIVLSPGCLNWHLKYEMILTLIVVTVPISEAAATISPKPESILMLLINHKIVLIFYALLVQKSFVKFFSLPRHRNDWQELTTGLTVVLSEFAAQFKLVELIYTTFAKLTDMI